MFGISVTVGLRASCGVATSVAFSPAFGVCELVRGRRTEGGCRLEGVLGSRRLGAGIRWSGYVDVVIVNIDGVESRTAIGWCTGGAIDVRGLMTVVVGLGGAVDGYVGDIVEDRQRIEGKTLRTRTRWFRYRGREGSLLKKRQREQLTMTQPEE